MSIAFPWTKVETAQRWLFAVKPWWFRYGSRFTIVPFDVPPPPGSPYGGVCYTTGDWRLFMDSTMAAKSSIETIAACIEREYHRSVRNIPERMSHASREDYQIAGHVAAEMEICSVMRQEYEDTNILMVMNDSSVKSVVSDDMRQLWGITSIPSLPDDMAIYPESLGFADGLRMEEYFSMIAFPEDDEESSDESSDDSEGDPSDEQGDVSDTADSDSGDYDFSDGSPESHSDHESDVDDESESDVDIEPEYESQDDSQGDVQDSDNGSIGEDEGSQDGDSEGQEGSESDSEGDEGESSEGSNQSLQDENEGHSDHGGEEEAKDDTIDTGEESTSGGPGGGNAVGEAPSMEDKINEILEEPGRRWYTRDYEPPEDSTVDDLFSDSTEQSAMQELAEDILQAQSSGGMGICPGDMILDMAEDIVRKGSISWESAWSQAMAHSVGEYNIMGGQDLSYSVRNPNQQNIGPIMMGMYDTQPTISVMLDMSGSMTGFLNDSLGTFADIVFTSIAGSGEPVRWITVDMVVNGVGEAHSIDDINLDKSKITRGFGGTDVGGAIEELVSGNLTWEGKVIDEPDILPIVTDCMFLWPWKNLKSTPCTAKILVASMLPWKQVEKFLPDWVVENENWFYIGD